MGRTPPKIIAVDPGLSGAIVYYSPDLHEISVRRDFKSISDIAEAATVGEDTNGRTYRAIIELVGSRPGQGIVSTSHFMIAYGTALGAIGSCVFRDEVKAPVFSVHPVRWQNWVRREIGIHDDTRVICEKNVFKPDYKGFDSRVYAISCFPESVHLFKRGKDHNTADAVLLAVYCYWFGREIWLRDYFSKMNAYRRGQRDEKPEFPDLEGTGLDNFPVPKDEPYQL